MPRTDISNKEPEEARGGLLYRRVPVGAHDQRVFVGKLLLLAVLLTAGSVLALNGSWTLSVPGMLLLGAMYAHAVELQHQCLHHSAFLRSRAHRSVGVLLGLPMMVSYSHYRVRHLQHHKRLGTPEDTEFFSFDAAQPVTLPALARASFDWARIAQVLRDVVRSFTGSWSYGFGPLPDRRRRQIMSEYRGMGVFLVALAVLAAVGWAGPVAKLWLIPLVVALPVHFFVELPEHVLCVNDSTDVLRNTRSIRGSAFSTWFTNGNNLHIEHHAAMSVPINRLPDRHDDVARQALHVEKSYPAFYRLILREAVHNRRRTG